MGDVFIGCRDERVFSFRTAMKARFMFNFCTPSRRPTNFPRVVLAVSTGEGEAFNDGAKLIVHDILIFFRTKWPVRLHELDKEHTEKHTALSTFI